MLGALTFVAEPVAYVALLLGEWRLRSGGVFIAPVSALTEVRLLAGTAGGSPRRPPGFAAARSPAAGRSPSLR